MARVLVIDDDAAVRETAAIALEKSGHEVDRVSTLDEARKRLSAGEFDVVLSDIYLKGETGLDLLEEIAALEDGPKVILMTARGSVETAAVAARTGAFDYVAKPFDLRVLLDRISAAVTPISDSIRAADAGPESMMIGSHPSMVEVYKAIAKVAPRDVSVLIRGETGTGKELVAQALHRLGSRPDGAFVAVNCGAIPDTLLESELFGHVRGAFTDARRDRKGAFARAAGGTVFLDEIGEVSSAFQVRLLRFLEDGVVTPLGAESGTRIDVRVVAATNRDLRKLVRDGAFREDLYYRLASYEIVVPPLRERASDIALLLNHFRAKVGRDAKGNVIAPPSAEVLAILESYLWPGNVRELEQFVRRMAIDSGALVDGSATKRVLRDLSGDVAEMTERADETPGEAGAEIASRSTGEPVSLEQVERRHILTVLESTGWNRTRAAELLGVERKTLRRKMKRLGIGDAERDQ